MALKCHCVQSSPEKTHQLANVRIHIERVIRKIEVFNANEPDVPATILCKNNIISTTSLNKSLPLIRTLYHYNMYGLADTIPYTWNMAIRTLYQAKSSNNIQLLNITDALSLCSIYNLN